MRLIDADALLDKLNEESIEYRADINHAIAHAPTVERHGKWIPLAKYGSYKCSECRAGSRVDEVGIPKLYWNYCPNCGAKMDKE